MSGRAVRATQFNDLRHPPRYSTELFLSTLKSTVPIVCAVVSGGGREHIGLLGRYAEAENLFTQTVEIDRRVLGHENAYGLNTLSSWQRLHLLSASLLPQQRFWP